MFSASVTKPTVPYLSHVTAAAALAEKYWHLHSSDCRYTTIYAHTTLPIVTTGYLILGSLTLPVPQAGEVWN
jgi:hypothetical protein